MSAHTPGPWEVADESLGPYAWAVESVRGDDVALGPINSGDTHAEEVANAHLIAAAPDLLAALEKAHENAAAALRGIVRPHNTVDLAVEMRAAIAKARGTL